MIGENHLHIIEKGAVQEQSVGAPYFNVPVSEKTSIQTKTFCLKDRTQTI